MLPLTLFLWVFGLFVTYSQAIQLKFMVLPSDPGTILTYEDEIPDNEALNIVNNMSRWSQGQFAAHWTSKVKKVVVTNDQRVRAGEAQNRSLLLMLTYVARHLTPDEDQKLRRNAWARLGMRVPQ